MAWALLLLTLLTQDTGSWAQPALTQPSSVSGALGGSVTITCAGSNSDIGNDIGGYNDVSWHQQIPGSSPKTMIYAVSTRPSGFPECFSGSKSGTTASLTISELQPEDEADYFCSSYTNTYNLHSGERARGSETKACPEPTAPSLL
uniref:Ig-like domain-containing protein n=1 Tax=Oryctolagus cuniculus TaxID=9986 RepID=A0A5F9C3Z1_RABIT